MGGDPQAMGAERSHRAPPAGHSRSAPVSWVLATASWITTVDHKRIGILYGVTAFAFFLLGGLEALLIRLQLAAPDAHVVSAETYNALFTMHGTTMVFLAIMPLNAAFFNYMVPLLIGARDVAFPRLNALPHRPRDPADRGRADLPHVRPVLRQPLLRRRGRRRPPPLAAPLLDLRAPRGLHPDPAGLRDRLRGAADLRAQAAVRRAGRRLFGRPDRLLRLRRVEPPHVRRGHGAGRGRRVLDRDHAHRDPDGREDLQLAGDALGRIDPRDDCVPLRGRPRRALHDRRALGHHARLAARGPPADRQLLRRRAPALRAHRRQPLRPLSRRARFRHDPSGPRERHVLEREVWSARGPPCPHPRPHPPPGSVPLAGGGRARHGGPGGRRAHPSHDRADGRARHDRRHLPSGTRAPPDPRARAPDGRPRPRPSEGRAVGVPRLRMLLLRHADRDVPRLQGKERGRPRTPRDPQHPADDGLDLRPPDVEPAHGAGAGGRRAGRPASRPPLAVRGGVLRADLPRLPGLGVHAVRAGRAGPSAEPVRLDLLRADRLPRRARGRGRGLAPLALAPRPPRSPPGRRRRQGGGGGALLALRGRRMDRDLHARLPDPVRAADANVTGAHATVRTYLKVALVLTGVTILEVGSIYIRQLTPIIVPLLLAMSAAKFALVVLFFMHLRYESRVLTLLFCGPLLLATGIMIALMTLTGAFLVFGR